MQYNTLNTTHKEYYFCSYSTAIVGRTDFSENSWKIEVFMGYLKGTWSFLARISNQGHLSLSMWTINSISVQAFQSKYTESSLRATLWFFDNIQRQTCDSNVLSKHRSSFSVSKARVYEPEYIPSLHWCTLQCKSTVYFINITNILKKNKYKTCNTILTEGLCAVLKWSMICKACLEITLNTPQDKMKLYTFCFAVPLFIGKHVVQLKFFLINTMRCPIWHIFHQAVLVIYKMVHGNMRGITHVMPSALGMSTSQT